MPELLLVTAATGKQASALINLLHASPEAKQRYRLRLQAHRQSSAESLKKRWPDAEVVTADLASLEDWRRILAGVDILYLVGPSFHAHETNVVKFAVDAVLDLNPGLAERYRYSFPAGTKEDATSPQFKHLIYSSVLHPCLSKLLNHDVKRYAEEYLIESGVPHTIIQPSHFMEMIATQAVLNQLDAQQNAFFPVNVNPDATFSFSNTIDDAHATVKIMAERDAHLFATYELVSTPPTTYRQVRDTLAELIADELKTARKASASGTGAGAEETLPLKVLASDQAVARIEQIFGGLSFERRGIAHRLMLYYSEQGLRGSTTVLRLLLGRDPTSLRDFLAQQVKEWRERKTTSVVP